MNTFAAWRFNHPDFYSGSTPGLSVTPQGRIALVDGDASVRQAIMLLLSTRPGERVMRPDYGCELHELMFAPNDDTAAGLAVHYVRQALTRWEPRVEILNLDANRAPDDSGTLQVLLEYRVLPTLTRDHLLLNLDVMQGAP